MDDFTRDILLRGASIAGDGANDDLDVNEVADALAEAKKRKISERSSNFQARRAERAGNQQEAETFLRDDSRRFQ